MLTSFMSFQVRVKFWLGFNLGEGKQSGIIKFHNTVGETWIQFPKWIVKVYYKV